MSNARRQRAPVALATRQPDPELTDPGDGQTAALVVPDHARLSAVVQRNLARIPGDSRHAETVNQVLAWCAKHTHLVTPAVSVGTIPEGCSVAFVTLWCNPKLKKDGGDCFPVQQERMPAKHILDQIAQAAGIKWDPQLGGRVDDGSHPHYCHYKAVAHVTHFDGTEAVLVREKQMDLRDGSPFVRKLEKDAANATDAKGNKRPRDPENQIIELRGFILEHAESKAKNRVVRSLGIKTSYTKEELSTKPFVVAKLMFTGETDNPELKLYFDQLRAQKMLGGTRALFGAPTTAQLHGGASPQIAQPPPIAAGGVDREDFPGGWIENGGRQVIDAPAASQPAQPPPQQEPPPQQGAGGGDDADKPSGVIIPGGDRKGAPIEDEAVTVEDLVYWAGRIEADIDKDVNDGGSRRPDFDKGRAKAMRDEIDWREGTDPSQ